MAQPITIHESIDPALPLESRGPALLSPEVLQMLSDHAKEIANTHASEKVEAFQLSLVKEEAIDKSQVPPEVMDELNELLNHIATLSVDQIQELIGKILVQLGIFLSEVQQTATQVSNDQVNISQAMAKHAQEENTHIQEKIKKEQEEQEAAESGFWGFLSKLFGNKVFQIILTAVIGLLFCESPIGFALLGGMIALQATGALDKMTTKLGDAMGGSTWEKVLAGVLITAVLAGGSGLAEGLGSAAISSIAKSTTEAVVEDGAPEAVESASWLTKSTGYYTSTTAMVLTQSLTETNLIYNFLLGCHANKKVAMGVAAVLNIIASIAAMGLGIKNGSSTVLDLMSSPGKLGTAFKYTALGVQGLTTVGSAGYGIKEGTIQMNVADIQKEIAPRQAEIVQLESLSKIFAEMIQITNNTIANIMKNQSNIFTVNFATGWQAVSQGLNLSA